MNDPCKVYLKPAPGERLEAVITLPEESRSVIFGQVRSSKGPPAAGLPVLLFEEESAVPLQQAITDEAGSFCFGPIPGGQLYYVQIFRGEANVRTVEVDI